MKDRQLIRFVSETPWALTPSALLTLRDIVAFHASGGRLTEVEIRERIGPGRPPAPKPGGAIAVLPIHGVIMPHAGLMSDMSGGVALDTWVEMFRAAVADEAVSTIVLDVDSPGGSVALVDEVATEIRAARGSKTIVAVANTMAASAAYYLASQAGELYVSPSGMVGSIGVFNIHTDFSGMNEQEGIDYTYVFAGEHKVDGNPDEPLSDEAKATMQATVRSYYDMFVQAVAKGRGVSTAQVEASYGQGRMLTAKDALAAGMVDGIQSLDETIARLLKGRPATKRARAELLVLTGPTGATGVIVDEDEAVEVEQVAALVGAGATGTAFMPTTVSVAFAELERGAGLTHAVRGAVTTARAESAPRGAHTKAKGTLITMDERPKTIEELRARQDEVKARQTELDTDYAGRLMDDDARAEFKALDDEWKLIEETVADLESRRANLEAKARDKKNIIEIGQAGTKSNLRNPSSVPDNIYDVAAYRGFAQNMDDLAGIYREGARRANEQTAYESDTPDKAKAHVERLLGKDDKDGAFAKSLLLTGSDLYDRSYGKLVMGRQLNTQEQQAIQAAVSHTGLGAETPVPITIDPTVLLTSDDAANPLRAISRVETITGLHWRGITSEGVTVVYEAELAQAGDQTPTFDTPEADVVKAHGYVEFSIEADDDWGGFRATLARMFQEAKDATEADKFLFGSGNDEPLGIVTALDGTASEINTDTANTLAIDDLDLLIADLPPKFDTGAQWIGNRSTFSALRTLAADRTDFWVPVSQGFKNIPGGTSRYTLLDYPVNIASGMSALVTTGGEDVLVLGDFGKGFVIVDRVGITTQINPMVLGANRRPTGAMGLYVYFRNTSLLMTEKAFRMLRIAVTS